MLFLAVMQTGFAFLEAGSVRSKNTTNILIKNFLDVCKYNRLIVFCFQVITHIPLQELSPVNAYCISLKTTDTAKKIRHFYRLGKDVLLIYVWLILQLFLSVIGAVAYWLFGFAFAFGAKSNKFIGHKYFALADLPSDKYSFWFFHFVFAATAATIVSGAMAERTEFKAYLLYSVFLTGEFKTFTKHFILSAGDWFGFPYAVLLFFFFSSLLKELSHGILTTYQITFTSKEI